jgi:hypothetical protein
MWERDTWGNHHIRTFALDHLNHGPAVRALNCARTNKNLVGGTHRSLPVASERANLN